MRFISSLLPAKFKVLSTIDLRNQGGSSTSLPFPVSARFPAEYKFPSLGLSPPKSSIISPVLSNKSRVPVPDEPLTNTEYLDMDQLHQQLPLLSQLRRDNIAGGTSMPSPVVLPPLSSCTGLPNPIPNPSFYHNAFHDCSAWLGLSSASTILLDNRMSFYFRAFPGQETFLGKSYVITNKIKERVTDLCNSIGFTSNSFPYFGPDVFSYSRLGRGLRGLVNEANYQNGQVIEVLTFFKGIYGRYIIHVGMGVSCTIWYMFVPGFADVAPIELLQRIGSYEQFMDPDSIQNAQNSIQGLHKAVFIERAYITDEVLKSIENDFPFTDMDIPSGRSSRTKIAVGLGLIIGVFLAMGIGPTGGAADSILTTVEESL